MPIYRIWLLVRTQLIVAGMGDPIAINHTALWEALDRFGKRYGVVDKEECFLKINYAFSVLSSEKRWQNHLGQKSSSKVPKKVARPGRR